MKPSHFLVQIDWHLRGTFYLHLKVTSTPCGKGDVKIQYKRDIIPQEKHLEREWASTKKNREKNSKETFLGCKAARWHYVGGGVVPWVSFGFSVFCVNRITCGKVSNATYCCIFIWWMTNIFNAALHAWSPTVHKGEKVRWSKVRYVEPWDRIQEEGKEKSKLSKCSKH